MNETALLGGIGYTFQTVWSFTSNTLKVYSSFSSKPLLEYDANKTRLRVIPAKYEIMLRILSANKGDSSPATIQRTQDFYEVALLFASLSRLLDDRRSEYCSSVGPSDVPGEIRMSVYEDAARKCMMIRIKDRLVYLVQRMKTEQLPNVNYLKVLMMLRHMGLHKRMGVWRASEIYYRILYTHGLTAEDRKRAHERLVAIPSESTPPSALDATITAAMNMTSSNRANAAAVHSVAMKEAAALLKDKLIIPPEAYAIAAASDSSHPEANTSARAKRREKLIADTKRRRKCNRRIDFITEAEEEDDDEALSECSVLGVSGVGGTTPKDSSEASKRSPEVVENETVYNMEDDDEADWVQSSDNEEDLYSDADDEDFIV